MAKVNLEKEEARNKHYVWDKPLIINGREIKSNKKERRN